MMEDLDPEQARVVIDPALKLMMDAAHRYDGYFVQSTGDGIFALFGAQIAHEDHPQWALHAALRLQENLERYSARLREAGNPPIEGRVGVNTGEVVVRSITTGVGQVEYTPIGHTTNLASRMQALAPTGSIAITDGRNSSGLWRTIQFEKNICAAEIAVTRLGDEARESGRRRRGALVSPLFAV